MDLVEALRIRQPLDGKPVVALTGAGGKSTLLFRLGQEMAATGRQTLLTTTTRLWARQMDLAPFSLVAGDERLLARELPISLRGYRQVLVLAGDAAEAGKVRGLPAETICRLAELADVEAVVVEADGSRERPLKAPADHEPVVPACATHALVVAGMAAAGQPLSPKWVHRPERVAAITGLAPGEDLTPQAIARLLLHQQGGLKGLPAGAQRHLYLNLMAGPDAPADEAGRRLEAARRLAQAVLAPLGGQEPGAGYRSVLIGSAAAASPVDEAHGRVAAIVLAAGASRRFGPEQVKQVLPWGDGNTLVGQAVDTALAAGCVTETIVVTGYGGDQVGRALQGRQVFQVANPDWAAGQSTSVRRGLEHALGASPHLSAALFLLADQPDVQAGTVDALVAAHRRTLAPVVVPLYQGGRWGNPVLFDRGTFPELAALRGDVGGRDLIRRYGDRVLAVPVDRPQPQGIDTPEAYRRRFRP